MTTDLIAIDGARSAPQAANGPPISGVHDFTDRERIVELERENAQLREALASRQQIGWVTGLLCQRYRLTPDQGWALLVRLSNNCNIKIRDAARIIHDSYCSRLAPADEPLAARLRAQLPDGALLAMVPHTTEADT